VSNLVEHAEREMRLAGLYDGDGLYGGMIPEAVMELVKVHAAQGHSGNSHSIVIAIFNKVINFKVLAPITSDPEEWQRLPDEYYPEPHWQNKRQSSCFSKDGGKTWYDIEDKNYG
jgi:hypothetical protein